jgi:hypothetical protein
MLENCDVLLKETKSLYCEIIVFLTSPILKYIQHFPNNSNIFTIICHENRH